MSHPIHNPSPVTHTTFCVVLVTCPNLSVASALSRQLVTENLAACVNLVPGITSVYKWEGTLCEDSEVLMVIKTNTSTVPTLTQWITAHHPYTCPEVITLPITDGFEPYLQWVTQQVQNQSPPHNA